MIGTESRSKLFSWNTAGRIGFTAIFFFWIYMISNSTADLDNKLNSATDQNTAIHNIQVDFKNEIQQWKDLLLRSTSRDTLNSNWSSFEALFQKVAAEAQDIIRQSESPAVSDQVKAFVDAHEANHELYRSGAELLMKNGFDPRPADTFVRGIDHPLLEHLEAAEASMIEDKKRINKTLVDATRNNIEQNLFVLAFLALLAVWMPKY
ncbi:methyl-accepting chemotaxis protein CtpH [mine drainage metagenome]|uniref:Methyl-accepting chemotaxis protein CtpH n=1 Tax=mine drainage metagenome TaxID=410659 RepID=A0A1J5SNJ4_9ZZZZ